MNLPPWLDQEAGRLSSLLDRDQLPHAMLVHGPVGVGRRWLAFWLAERLLDQKAAVSDSALLGVGRIEDEALPAHPDFRLLQPCEDKRTVSIEQVRELIGFLALTSHQSGAKVAVVAPAQMMTPAAANCLLKTLEEPTPGSYLILVAGALSRLPPTIISRCHRVRVPVPERQVAGQWLLDRDPKVDWQNVLDLCAGAPLTALDLHGSGFARLAHELEQDLTTLLQRTASPSSVAKRWIKHDQESCLLWLSNKVSADIRAKFAHRQPASVAKPGNGRLQNAGETLNMEPSFAVLRQIGELRRMQGSGLNAELHLTHVLARWCGTD